MFRPASEHARCMREGLITTLISYSSRTVEGIYLDETCPINDYI